MGHAKYILVIILDVNYEIVPILTNRRNDNPFFKMKFYELQHL